MSWIWLKPFSEWKKTNPVFCEWKQGLAFVNWVFLCSATTVQMKMVISCRQMGTWTKPWSKCGFSARQFWLGCHNKCNCPFRTATGKENLNRKCVFHCIMVNSYKEAVRPKYKYPALKDLGKSTQKVQDS